MGKQHVIARLRPVKDDDIRAAMSKLPVYYDEADIVREALRQFLFTHKGRMPLIKGNQVFNEDEVNDHNNKEESNVETLDIDEFEDSDELDAKLNDFLTS